jgi:hypothetical protein
MEDPDLVWCGGVRTSPQARKFGPRVHSRNERLWNVPKRVEKPGDLTVMGLTKFAFVINLIDIRQSGCQTDITGRLIVTANADELRSL